MAGDPEKICLKVKNRQHDGKMIFKSTTLECLFITKIIGDKTIHIRRD